jgi:hypothetical protein
MRERGTREKRRGTVGSSNSTDFCGSHCGLRREISPWFVDDFAKEQREMEEE